MAAPTKTIVTQTYEGETITCAKFSCTETSDFKFSKVAPIGGNYQFQVVIRASAARTISVQIGGETKTITVSSTFKRYTLSWMGVSVSNSTDLIMSFPSGDYWLYNIQLERATSPSGWRPAPEDSEDYADQVASTAVATAATYADLTAEQKAAAAVEAQTQQTIFNKLTNNGQVQGLYLSGGKIYLNATYIQTGTISIKKNNLETFYANADTGVIRIKADEFSLSDGTTLASAAQAAVDGQTQLSIFNKLTNNGQTQGIYLSSSKIYINASYIRTGAFSVSKNGTQTFYADAATGVVKIKADEFSLSDGTTLASTLSTAESYADSHDTTTLNSAKSYANSAANSAVEAQTQLSIFNKLTNNGQTQGIYLSSSKIYINASYIQTGTLSIKKNNVQTFYANASTGVIKIKADEFSLSDGTTLASTLSTAESYADSAATSAVNAQTQLSIFNKLTNNGQTQGIYLSNSKIYINASYISTGTMSAARISGGTLQDTQGNMVWNLTSGAMTAKNLSITSTNFTLTNAGVITAKSGSIGGWNITSYGLYKSSNGVWTSYIGDSGYIRRSIAGSGSRSDWIAVFGDNFGVNVNGAFYCSSGYINNVLIEADCDPTPVAGKVITAATAQIQTIIANTVDANYITAKSAVLGKMSTTSTGISVDGGISSSGTIVANSFYSRNGYDIYGASGAASALRIYDPNGTLAISLDFTGGIFTGGSTGTVNLSCTKTFYYTKTQKTIYAYASSTSSSRIAYSFDYVSYISASSGGTAVTI